MHTDQELNRELQIRLEKVNVIASYLRRDFRELLKDATTGRGRKFGETRTTPIDKKLDPYK